MDSTHSAVTHSGPSAPVAGAERVEIVDILRGFAIFGILLVNIEVIFAPFYVALLPDETRWTGTLDRLIDNLVVFFAQGKFYALFAMLFGLGLAIQVDRAEARGAPVAAFFARRMFWLLVIGGAHVVLLWFGDILVIYSLLGFVLIVFRKRKPKTLLIWIVILLAIPLLLGSGFTVFIGLASRIPEVAGDLAEVFEANREAMAAFVERAHADYLSSSFGVVTGMRLTEWQAIFWTNLLQLGPQILALFLVGLYLGRTRFFHDLPRNVPRVRKSIWWLLAGGLTGSTVLVVAMHIADFSRPNAASMLALVGMLLGAPAMSAFYVAAIVLLAQRPGWRRRLAPLAYVGRMALTNYLMHSVVFTTVAYGYGFGLYGRVSPTLGLVLTVAMFLLQILLSRWWLNRFRFGPMEWLWRSLTYRRIQPMRPVAAGSV